MILIINAGSSSIKFQLYDINNEQYIVKCKGLAERIGIDGKLTFEYGSPINKESKNLLLSDHNVTAKIILEQLKEKNIIKDFKDVAGVGHRIVHGSTKITKSVIVNDEVIKTIKECIKLAPLHNPAGLAALTAFQNVIKNPHIAVFDTTFHTTMPKINYTYPVPNSWTNQYSVRRYGFHGISYQYIIKKLSEIIKKPINEINTIVCHLGNGASICAIKNGKSYNTSMGFTPLAGLMMGTRSGDIDPSIIEYMANELKSNSNNQPLLASEVTNILNKQSGLLGISGSSDLRDIIAKKDEDPNSMFALQLFTKRIADFIVQYQNDLENKVDALVFTAGIGENSNLIRQMVIGKVKTLNLSLDEDKNNQNYDDYLLISNLKSQCNIYKIRTNEELMICQDTLDLINNN